VAQVVGFPAVIGNEEHGVPWQDVLRLLTDEVCISVCTRGGRISKCAFWRIP
jgi:hypothetical protein